MEILVSILNPMPTSRSTIPADGQSRRIPAKSTRQDYSQLFGKGRFSFTPDFTHFHLLTGSAAIRLGPGESNFLTLEKNKKFRLKIKKEITLKVSEPAGIRITHLAPPGIGPDGDPHEREIDPN